MDDKDMRKIAEIKSEGYRKIKNIEEGSTYE